MKKTPGMMVCVVVILLFAVPSAFGQALDGQWFQLKVSHKGYGFDPGGIYKISGSITNYMFLTWDGVTKGSIIDWTSLSGNLPHPSLPKRGNSSL